MTNKLEAHIAAISTTFQSWQDVLKGSSRISFENAVEPDAVPRPLPEALYVAILHHLSDSSETLAPAVKGVIGKTLGNSVTPEQVASLLRHIGSETERRAAESWNLPFTIEPDGHLWTSLKDISIHYDGTWFFTLRVQRAELNRAANTAAFIAVMLDGHR